MTVALNAVAGALVGFLVVGDGVTFTATSTSGDWPATTRLRVANSAGVETAFTPTIATTLATWTLTVAEVTALIGTKTSGQLSARITHGTGDALRGILAGPLTLISEWTGVRGTQSLGAVVVGPEGPTAVSADADNVASLGTDGLIYVAPGAGTVASVNGETGVVVLSAADVGAAPALGADDNYVTDAEKAKLSNLSGTNTGDQTLPTWSTISGKPAVVAEGATQAAARTAIGAGTSSFSGAYADLSGKPTLGTAAATAATDYATAAQGSLADSATQPGDDAADQGSGAAADGYVLTADGLGGAAWEAVPAGGSPALDDLSDVATAGAATGEVLGFNGTSWAPTAAAAILEGDARLTDARTPTSHTHAATEVTSGTLDAARLPAASETAAGAVELATTSEATTGTDTTRAVTPAGVKAVGDTKIPASIVDAKGDLIVATAADTVARLPVGATTGHVLTVDPAESTGLKWAAAAGGGAVATDAIWDAKGDLAAGTGANTAAKVTVGTNGHVLTADSAETAGVKWAAPAADPWTQVRATSDTTNDTTSDVNCSGLSITGLADGDYEVYGLLKITSAATTTGARYGITLPTGVTGPVRLEGLNTSSALYIQFGYGTTVNTSPATPYATDPIIATLTALLTVSSMSGNIEITIKSEVAASQVAVKAGSFLRYRKIA